MAAKLGLGYPAKPKEIEIFGNQAKRVIRVERKEVDERSFATVLTEEMYRKEGQSGGAGFNPGWRGQPNQRQEEGEFRRTNQYQQNQF